MSNNQNTNRHIFKLQSTVSPSSNPKSQWSIGSQLQHYSSVLKSLKKHEEYYYDGGDLIVIVGDISFRVPSVFFTRESQIFKDRLAEGQTAKPSGIDSPTKTRANDHGDVCPTHTIVIEAEENVTAEDFANLCWVFFNPKLSIYDASLNKWKTILRLANQWHFAEVKDLAFRELDIPGKFSLSIVERITLYRQYTGDRKYLEPLYEQLLSRPESLTVEEGESLGMTSALLISGARERLRATSDRLTLSAPLPDSMKGTIQEMVGSIFWNGPAPDLSRFNNSLTSKSSSFNGCDSASTSTGANDNPSPVGTSSDKGSFNTGFKVAGKKGKKKNGLLGDWDD